MNYGERLRDGFDQWRDDEVPDIRPDIYEEDIYDLESIEERLPDYEFA